MVYNKRDIHFVVYKITRNTQMYLTSIKKIVLGQVLRSMQNNQQ